MTPVRLEPAALRSRVKRSITEPLRSLKFQVVAEKSLTEKKSLQTNKQTDRQT